METGSDDFYRSKFYLLFHWPLFWVLFTLNTIFRSSHVRTKDARQRNKIMTHLIIRLASSILTTHLLYRSSETHGFM